MLRAEEIDFTPYAAYQLAVEISGAFAVCTGEIRVTICACLLGRWCASLLDFRPLSGSASYGIPARCFANRTATILPAEDWVLWSGELHQPENYLHQHQLSVDSSPAAKRQLWNQICQYER